MRALLRDFFFLFPTLALCAFFLSSSNSSHHPHIYRSPTLPLPVTIVVIVFFINSYRIRVREFHIVQNSREGCSHECLRCRQYKRRRRRRGNTYYNNAYFFPFLFFSRIVNSWSRSVLLISRTWCQRRVTFFSLLSISPRHSKKTIDVIARLILLNF